MSVNHLPHCVEEDPLNPSTCDVCEATHYFNGTACVPCDNIDEMEGCNTCGDNTYECYTCLVNYSLASNSLCLLTHCVEGKFTAIDTCTECMAGYVLNIDGTCTPSCSDPANYIEDRIRKVCRLKCASDQYHDNNNFDQCNDCSSAINNCNKCNYTDGIIGKFPVVCENCVNALAPNPAGSACTMQNCATVMPSFSTRCSTCATGFFRHYSTTRCN